MRDKIDPDEPDAVTALRLVTVYCDGSTTLLSRTHRYVVGDFDGHHAQKFIPHVDMDDQMERACHTPALLAEYDARHKDGGSPGFPGWDAVFDYLEKHPEVLE